MHYYGFNLGLMFQIIGLFAGVLAMMVYIFAVRDTDSKNHTSYKIASMLLYAQAVAVTVAIGVLLYILMASKFNYTYVLNYTDRALPMIYKFTALWAGQAGSLLLWAWLASLFAAIEVFRLRKTQNRTYKSFMLLMGLLNATFFLFICTFVTSPFEMLPQGFGFKQTIDGAGMNPMLQNPGMIIHPPLLYIGFVGFIIPFAHAFASMCTKDTSVYWLKQSRPWILFTWVFLTAGIVLGAWWAYVELGWGGYWAWDPVENASLFPWITATALIHAAIIYEKKGRMKAWTYVLMMITFVLTIFGTYLTRSGIMTDSVHSFGKSALGGFFLMFIVIVIVIYLAAYIVNRNNLKDPADFNFLSREGIFFVGILCFVALTLALIFYTMLPVLSQNILGSKISVQLSSYNLVSAPFFIAIFLLAGLAPIMSYGQMGGNKLLKLYIPVLVFGFTVTVIASIINYLSPNIMAHPPRIGAVMLTFTAATSFFSFCWLAFKMIKNGGIGMFLKNRRLFGAVVVHIGLSITAFGVIFSAYYNIMDEQVLTPNSSFEFMDYRINVADIEHASGENYESDYLPIQVTRDGREETVLYPEIRTYNNRPENVYGEVAYNSTIKGDLYFILNGFDKSRNMIRVTAIYEPLLGWIWVGSIIMCIGGLIGMTHRDKRNETA